MTAPTGGAAEGARRRIVVVASRLAADGGAPDPAVIATAATVLVGLEKKGLEFGVSPRDWILASVDLPAACLAAVIQSRRAGPGGGS